MTSLSGALQQLREEHKHAQAQVKKLEDAITSLSELVGGRTAASARNGGRGTRSVSLAARRRIALAQKARWTKWRQSHTASSGKTSPVRRPLSSAARKKIAAAQRARWARFRSNQQKTAA